MAIETSKIRNVGVVGHGGVGKTTLVEALLYTAGAVTRLGRTDDGTTTTDFDPDEIKRKISINTAVAYVDWKGHRINLVDTPGYGDFISEAKAGLRVVEAALVVVDAVAGVQVQTEKVWKFATEYELPRAVVINRLDRERADFYRTLESLGRRLKGRLVPVQLPVGEEAGFSGVVDLVTLKATVYADGKPKEAEIPADLADRVKEYREKLVEAAAETDDDLLNKYLEEGALAEAEVVKALRSGITTGKIVPVLCAAAAKNIGSQALLDLIVEAFPSPLERRGHGRRRRQDQADGHARRGRQGPGHRAGVQDPQRSPRGQAVALSRLHGHPQIGLHPAQRLARRPRAHGTHRLAPGQDLEARRRRWARVRSGWWPS